MPIVTYDMSQIRESFRANPHNRWGKGEDRSITSPADASSRIHKPTLPMWLRDSDLRIKEDSSIFAMGSCFARSIEDLFFQRGFTIASRPPFQLMPSGKAEYGALNRYNTPSMLLEFERLLENPAVIPDDALLIEDRPGTYNEAHYHFGTFGTLEDILERRRRFHAELQKLRSADLIVLTLGLNEAGYEVRTGLYRNVSPTVKEMRKGVPLEVRMLSVRDNVDCLVAIRSLIRKHCHKNPPIVVTVSPVPLQFTYLMEDIVSANGAGKATLRAAASEFCYSYPDVYYFPSYEIAINSAHQSVFKSDKVHIHSQFVDHIIGQFVDRYVEQASDSAAPRERTDEIPVLSI
jgi:hypothetical protein